MKKNYFFALLFIALFAFTSNTVFSQTESALQNPLTGKNAIHIDDNKTPVVDTKSATWSRFIPRQLTDAVNVYAVVRTTGITYTPIAGGTAVTSWRNGIDIDDNMSNNQPIGFSYVYNGVRTDSFRVSTSGFVTFNTTSSAVGSGTGAYGYDNIQFSAAGGTSNTLAPIYDDLQVPSLATSIVYQTTGSAGNRILTVEFIGMDFSANTTPDLNFEVKCYEVDGHVEFIYGTMTAGTPSYSYSSGINAATLSAVPTVGQLLTQQTANTGTFSNTAQNALATVPATNSMISFTTPAQTPPASPTSLTFTGTSSISTTLNWVDNSSNETEFPVYISSDGGVTFNYIGAAAANATSVGITGLLPATTYFFQVWAANETQYSLAAATGSVTTLTTVPLSGAYTIDPFSPVSSTNFQTFQQCDTALSNNGVNGPVTVTVSGGTYAEVVTLTTIIGTSATNTVKFQGPLSETRVLIKPVGTAAVNNYAIGIFGADWVTYQYIDVEDGGTSVANQIEYGYVLQQNTNPDGATNNTIRDCSILLGGGGVAPGFSHAVLQSTITTATQGNNNNTYTNIKIDRSDRGVAVFGLTAPALPTEDNIVISNCVLGQTFPIGDNLSGTSGSPIGIIISNGKNSIVSGNDIVSVQATNIATTSGPIALSCQNSNGSFFNNKIRDVLSGNTTNNLVRPAGISGSGLLPDTAKIYNNFVSGIRKGYTGVTPTATVALVGLRSTQQGGAGVVRWDYNTVYLSSPAPVYFTSCAYASFAGGVTYITRNNILYNNISTASATSRSVAIQDANAQTAPAPSGFMRSNFNDLYAPGTNGSVGLNGAATFRTTLALWQSNNTSVALSLDTASTSTLVTFVNTATGDLHLAGASLGDINLLASPIAGITTDIDGDARSAIKPYKGADEGSTGLSTLNLKVSFEIYNTIDTITVELRNNTSPYALVESVRGLGGLSTTQGIHFANAVDGTPYCIVVKYRNGIPTWSSLDVTFSGHTASYDFTSAITQAYLSNMKIPTSGPSTGVPSIFQGKIASAPGVVIGLPDIISVANAAALFVSGYNINNLDGVGFVGLPDIIVVFNNSAGFVKEKPRP